MPRQTSSEEIARLVRAVSDQSRKTLVEQWVAAYGRPPPKGISRRLLERAAAYHLQVAVLGGLRPAISRRLFRGGGDDSPPHAAERRQGVVRLSSGTRLVREWNGRTHTVEVTDDGFQWNGRTWRSLSAVAAAISGTRWSGPRFFGL